MQTAERSTLEKQRANGQLSAKQPPRQVMWRTLKRSAQGGACPIYTSHVTRPDYCKALTVQ